MQITTFYQNIYDTLAKIEIAITFVQLHIFQQAIDNFHDL